MLMILYTEQQLQIIHDIKNNENVILSSAHGTGKSMIFINQATYYNDLYYSIGRTDYNLTDLCRQYQHENLARSLHTRLFLDNVLVNDVNCFKNNLNNLASRLRNIHIIAYFKNTHNILRYFPNSTRLTKYFGQPTQLLLPNKKKGDYSCLSNLITDHYKEVGSPIYQVDNGNYNIDRYDKVIDNTFTYDYKMEGRFPKQYYHGFSQTLYYTPTLIIRVNDFNEEIDERLLKATDQLILLKRQPTILTNYTLLHQHSTNHNDPNKNTQHATQDQTT